jgi:hypothetical protein
MPKMGVGGAGWHGAMIVSSRDMPLKLQRMPCLRLISKDSAPELPRQQGSRLIHRLSKPWEVRSLRVGLKLLDE